MTMQPTTDTDDLAAAISEFEANLPGWWWSIGHCSVSRDASCGPEMSGPDGALIEDRAVPPEDRLFDRGFHCDDKNGTLASSLRNVMHQAMEARAEARKAAPAAKGKR